MAYDNRLAQGEEGVTIGTNTIFFLSHDKIRCIPKDRVITYARIVIDHRLQKDDPNRVRITVGGNLIDYPYKLTIRTADMVSTKIMWKNVISTPGAKFGGADIKNMYLETPLDRYEYMKMPMRLIPNDIIEHYGLQEKALNGYVYMEYAAACTDSHRPASLPTSSSIRALLAMATSNNRTLPACGSTSPGPSGSTCASTTLG
jgi:hypothetical protein